MEAFAEGEVIIYEAHLDDRLMVIEKIYPKDHTHRPNIVIMRSIDGLDIRDTTVDRIRKATREALINEILRLQSSLDTLRGAMRNQTFGDKMEGRRSHV
jgi:hypothetical protein